MSRWGKRFTVHFKPPAHNEGISAVGLVYLTKAEPLLPSLPVFFLTRSPLQKALHTLFCCLNGGRATREKTDWSGAWAERGLGEHSLGVG